MNEKSLTVLEQYDLEVKEIYRVKGNYGCETKDGKYILQEYNNSNEKMAVMKKLYDYLEGKGFCTDYVIINKDGEYVSVSEDGYTYILKRWLFAEESSINNLRHMCLGAQNLGNFHQCCQNVAEICQGTRGFHPGENIVNSYQRHNHEIVRIKNYIKKRKNKNYFEMSLHNIIDRYYEQAQNAVDVLKKSDYEVLYESAVKNKTLNHGSYNYHNIMMNNNQVFMVNMMKINYAPQIQDLYDYLRKIMEKNNWDIHFADDVLESYGKVRSISAGEYEILKTMFRYPEKFWKIINYYYNSNKAWYSEKNEEKLKQFKKQENLRWNFIKNM